MCRQMPRAGTLRAANREQLMYGKLWTPMNGVQDAPVMVDAGQTASAAEIRAAARQRAHDSMERERREQEQLAKFRKERPKIQQQFADLKRQLTEVSHEEWSSLPEAADIGKKTKKRRLMEKFSAAPDSLLLGAQASMSRLHQAASFDSGTATAFPSGTQTAFASGTATAYPGQATA